MSSKTLSSLMRTTLAAFTVASLLASAFLIIPNLFSCNVGQKRLYVVKAPASSLYCIYIKIPTKQPYFLRPYEAGATDTCSTDPKAVEATADQLQATFNAQRNECLALRKDPFRLAAHYWRQLLQNE